MKNEKKKITTRDIARVCGLSQSTVSMILSEKANVQFSQETIRKVQKTASDLGYIYKPRTPKKKNYPQNSILIMCPSISTQYYTTLIQAITEYAKNYDLYTLTACTMRTADREEYYLHTAIASGLYGVIYTYPPKAVSLLNQLSSQYPIILINDYNPNLKLGLLELDSKKSGQLIAKHLLDLGHRDIAYLSTPLSATELPRIRRLQGMKEEYEKNGIDPSHVHVYSLTEDVWDSFPPGNNQYNTGYHLAMDYFKHPSHITAFVGTNDTVALGIIDALSRLGFSVPKDFSVCGFDNTLNSSLSGISLTTIDHCIWEKGKDAVTMLMNQKQWLIRDASKRKPPIMRLEYEPQLIVRRSTCPPKKA